MIDGNPFAEDDNDRTVIRPNPGGRLPPRPVAGLGAQPAAPGAGSEIVALDAGGLNPFVAAAAPILALVTRLRSSLRQPDIERLRERVAVALRRFAERVAATGLPADAQKAGHYALCATVDDVISNTPWGATGWARQSMTGTFHNDVSGGERFFEYLSHLQRDPGRFGDVLELMYLCLSLGFEGRLRVAARGASELALIREGLYATVRQRRGEFERDLSPQWHGVEKPHRPITAVLPGWVVAAAAAAILLVCYMGFSLALAGASDATFERMAQLPPTGNVALQVAAPAPPPAANDGTLDRLRAFLAPEIRDHLVTLSESGRTATIQLSSQEMFASGSATLNHALVPLLQRVAEALNGEPGAIAVRGHTDNVPIRSLRFPSNYELSKGRAEAVATIIRPSLSQPGRVTAEGRADAEPLAVNNTAEGRAANRRIEVVLSKPGQDALPAAAAK
jgi:type VI secretion system protein ImpK